MTENEINKAQFSNGITAFGERGLLALAITIRSLTDQSLHNINLASLLAWHDKLAFLDLLLAKIPSLMWQRTIEDENNSVLTTPIEAAAHSRDPLLFKAVLSHQVMIDYAKSNPIEYLSLITDCLDKSTLWFRFTMTPEESVILIRLTYEKNMLTCADVK